MSNRIPLRRVSQIKALEDTDLFEGYKDGWKGESGPGDNRSFSYWHGWRNGAVDGGHRKSDSAQTELARDYVQQQRDSITKARPASPTTS